MEKPVSAALNSASVRDDYVPKDDYLDPDFAALEADHLWPNVWQVACREEEIPNPGDFITYDIGRDSIIVLRSQDRSIRAFFNACPHRGRRLLGSHGHVTQIQCRFHGWRWNLEGSNSSVMDRKDWAGCLADEDIALASVNAASWGGFVFITMEEEPQPLAEFLEPMSSLCRNFEFEHMRYRWYKTVRLKCNWKTAIEAFNEGYHVAQTHPQLLNYFDDYTVSKSYGHHSAFWYPSYPPIQRSPRLDPTTETPDYRTLVLEYVEEFDKQLMAMVTPRAYAAAHRMVEELQPDATIEEVLVKWNGLTQEAAEKDGAGWPQLTMEEIAASHADWHVFPNTVFLHGNIDGLLWYRVRPDSDDPDRCLFDVWSLVRYAPGEEPPLKREFYESWRDHDGWGRILLQDFNNMEEVQRGMHVRSFRGSRTNPVQERAVSNFHRVLHRHIEDSLARST